MRSVPYIPQKGDIIWLNFSPQSGREQKGHRPALVVSSRTYNRTGLLLACPITSQIKGYPFEVILHATPINGCVLADHIKNQDWKARKAVFITKAPPDVIAQVQKLIAALLVN